MAKAPQTEENGPHVHDWYYQGVDMSCQRCKCGWILVSRPEYERRIKDWEVYFEEIKSTESYSDFHEMKYYFSLWKQFNNPVDLAKIREIEARVHTRMEKIEDLNDPNKENRNNDLGWDVKHSYRITPKFPDPITFHKYEIS